MVFQITKAVIPAAGLGTRFLPATKAMPKEMLPVVDKPAIQYVVEEAVSAGLHDVLMITGRNKNALENHFDRQGELEARLEHKGDKERLAQVEYTSHLADVHYVRQGDPLGLGHAVLRAKMHVGREMFAVLLGDDIIDPRDVLLSRMIEVAAEKHATVVALLEVDPSVAHMYGVATVEPSDADDVVRITGLVEKPPAGTAPSNLAVIGRYVLRPEVFDVLEQTPPGKGGEIQLTDALQAMSTAPDWTGGVYGVVFRGRRYDTGDKLDYIKAIVQLAADRDDLGGEFRSWLKEFTGRIGDRVTEPVSSQTGAIPVQRLSTHTGAIPVQRNGGSRPDAGGAAASPISADDADQSSVEAALTD
ncbi:UTP--glucose-1-phosphate uridylyltransferase GalU [Ruicaihuangia caeni]|uniref:UTP--glucose-1-phosphate uridylyltransferase n=1 Tax=Ruicaihuangia caeni TaxID=3042517 RepID=A0AAW6T6E9_9MICO|nr:UTP--glucose-1-phosphate uridylyltransferase GalU [Klugiella sp. YN-L-19]MDI2098799.1 UTP--glucose-1-phosphate uridylyltransferase GalU [Klugiella sp. YN-L-19]